MSIVFPNSAITCDGQVLILTIQYCKQPITDYWLFLTRNSKNRISLLTKIESCLRRYNLKSLILSSFVITWICITLMTDWIAGKLGRKCVLLGFLNNKLGVFYPFYSIQNINWKVVLFIYDFHNLDFFVSFCLNFSLNYNWWHNCLGLNKSWICIEITSASLLNNTKCHLFVRTCTVQGRLTEHCTYCTVLHWSSRIFAEIAVWRIIEIEQYSYRGGIKIMNFIQGWCLHLREACNDHGPWLGLS